MSRLEQLTRELWPDGDRRGGLQVVAVLDGAQDPRIVPLVRSAGEHACLFAGTLSVALPAAAPRPAAFTC